MTLMMVLLVALVVVALVFVYLGFTYAEKYLFVAVFLITLGLIGFSLFFTFRQVRLGTKDKDPSTDATFGVDPAPTEKLPFDFRPKNPGSSTTSFPPTKENPRRPVNPNPFPPVKKQPISSDSLINPQTPQQFDQILQSPKRDVYLIGVISNKKSKYRYFALQKVIQLGLTHLQRKLRLIYQMESRHAKPDQYYQIQLLRTIWKLNPSFLEPQEQEWLKKKGIVLK